MDGKLIYIYLYISFASRFFVLHLHAHTTTCIYTLTHNITFGVCFLFPYIYIYRLAMWAASGLILQGCTNHMGGVEAITQSLKDNMF